MSWIIKVLLPSVLFLGSCTGSTVYWKTLDDKTLSADDIDSEVERLIAANDVKGIAVALIDDGHVIHARGYGKRMVEKDLPMEAETIIYGASLTKATFAYYVMSLVDKGVIDLDQPIETYLPQPLPDYSDYKDIAGDDRWRELTMRYLLSHQPGFQNWRFLRQEGGFDREGKLAFYFNPGDRYAYSGEGFKLAQRVLEWGHGIDVGAEMQSQIFDRFDMPKTSMTWREDFLENYSHNYSIEGENLRHNIRDEVGAAGSMDTTLADWSKFLTAVTRGDGLSPAAKEEMISPQIRIRSTAQFPTLNDWPTTAYDDIQLSYGLGWGLFETPYGRAFFKEGHDDGTANYAICIDARQKCLLLMSNSLRSEGIFKELVEVLLGDVGLPWKWEGYIPYDHTE